MTLHIFEVVTGDDCRAIEARNEADAIAQAIFIDYGVAEPTDDLIAEYRAIDHGPA